MTDIFSLKVEEIVSKIKDAQLTSVEVCQKYIERIDKFEKDDRKSQGIVGGGLRPDIKKSTDLSMTHVSGWEDEDRIFYKSLNKNIINYENIFKYFYIKQYLSNGQ